MLASALAVLLMLFPSMTLAAGVETKQGIIQTYRASGQATEPGVFSLPLLTAGPNGWLLNFGCIEGGNPTTPTNDLWIGSTIGRLPISPVTSVCQTGWIVLPPGEVLTCQTFYNVTPTGPLVCTVTGYDPDRWVP